MQENVITTAITDPHMLQMNVYEPSGANKHSNDSIKLKHIEFKQNHHKSSNYQNGTILEETKKISRKKIFPKKQQNLSRSQHA
uniref:Uncharacterized protein n=1 Tax=Glossina brevipalpis TaxID=37001 RepID=A0A1A9WLV4_9MUSC